jgi:hypothetical protein
MEVIPVTYLMEVIPVTYLMEIIPVTWNNLHQVRFKSKG